MKRHKKRFVAYRKGALVKMRNVGQTASSDPLFKGPFEIMERVTGGYNIAHRGTNTVINITPVPPEQLAPWKRVAAAEKEDEHVLTTERYEFTGILDHRDSDFNDESAYYIQWANGEKTWEPASIFLDNPMALSRYFRNLRKAASTKLVNVSKKQRVSVSKGKSVQNESNQMLLIQV